MGVARLRTLLPAGLRSRGRAAIRRVRYRGGQRHCPVCRARLSRFLPSPRTGRPDSVCPVCGSQERHRWIWLFLLQHTDLPRRAQRVLHVAPEHCYQTALRGWRHLEYVTLDLHRPDVMVRADLTALGFESIAFDFLLCNHVLEHVPDDGAAMREMFRVLRPGGTAVISVPGPSRESRLAPDLAETIEGRALQPEERAARFGHPGHLRQYGGDLADRLGAAGFAVELRRFGADWPPAEKRRLGSYDGYPIWVCRR
jgi:SAM-dependent methyltransferase